MQANVPEDRRYFRRSIEMRSQYYRLFRKVILPVRILPVGVRTGNLESVCLVLCVKLPFGRRFLTIHFVISFVDLFGRKGSVNKLETVSLQSGLEDVRLLNNNNRRIQTV